jgi:hypothetical protein
MGDSPARGLSTEVAQAELLRITTDILATCLGSTGPLDFARPIFVNNGPMLRTLHDVRQPAGGQSCFGKSRMLRTVAARNE